MRLFIASIIISLCLLGACSDSIEDQINVQLPLTEQKLAELKQALSDGEVENAVLIQQYANKLLTLNPKLEQPVAVLIRNAGSEGQLYKRLYERLQTVSFQSDLFVSEELRYQELLNIYQAADPILFSDALSDPLNVLADLSQGQLQRVNAETKSLTLQKNQAEDFGAAALLIAHPAFGTWQTNSENEVTWQWFNRTKPLSTLLKRSSVDYEEWAKYRDYSFYADIGRSRYSSVFTLARQTEIEEELSSPGAFALQRFGDSDLSAPGLVLKSGYHQF
ncbi:hypothetical protein [Thalassotalea mangrovi]|uniref:Uncharacterized protein n=1 Tax=Thalassotalea mangrovi TaxID=2572245 RepID=A0A4U1B9X6_9GAMM|nr:hypothetical protein [Thalassotalea mangrovi]TKB47194.1 hypothetical protein E8M12_02740 [Thalassotalea mangrovi]